MRAASRQGAKSALQAPSSPSSPQSSISPSTRFQLPRVPARRKFDAAPQRRASVASQATSDESKFEFRQKLKGEARTIHFYFIVRRFFFFFFSTPPSPFVLVLPLSAAAAAATTRTRTRTTTTTTTTAPPTRRSLLLSSSAASAALASAAMLLAPLQAALAEEGTATAAEAEAEAAATSSSSSSSTSSSLFVPDLRELPLPEAYVETSRALIKSLRDAIEADLSDADESKVRMFFFFFFFELPFLFFFSLSPSLVFPSPLLLTSAPLSYQKNTRNSKGPPQGRAGQGQRAGVDFAVGRRQGARGRRLRVALGADGGAPRARRLLLEEGPEGAAGQGDGGEASRGTRRGGAGAARREGEEEGVVFVAIDQGGRRRKEGLGIGKERRGRSPRNMQFFST